MAFSRPRVLVMADVPGWAWDWKARAYRQYLSDAFDVVVAYRAGYYAEPIPASFSSFALVHTFEFPQVDLVPLDYPGKLVTGLTAHVWPTWGPERVQVWADRAAALHGNSRLLVQEIQRFHPRVYYTPNGIDPQLFRRLRPRESPPIVACHVGKPNPRKGAHLIEAACRLVGVPLALNQRRVWEALSRQEMVDLYQDVWVQVTCSSKDGTPGPMLESAACENALLSNPIGNMPELLEDGVNGFVHDQSIEAMAEKLAWCRDHPKDTEEMGRAARKTILSGWTWEQNVEYVRTMWREVLNAP